MDGPTNGRPPRIDVKFETGQIAFESTDCDKANMDISKGKLVNGRQGINWKLIADTTLNRAGILTAEYILDVTQIKIGIGVANAAAAAIAAEAVRLLHPSPNIL